MGLEWLPVQRHWRLNERHYGALQGLDKKQTAERHGAEQTHLWRRSYDVPPPPVDPSSPEHPANDWRYRWLDSRGAPGQRVPRRRRRPRAPLLAGRHRPAAARRPRRARHRPRQLAAGAADAPRRASPARRSPRSTSRPACRAATSSTTPSGSSPPSTSATPTRSPPRPPPSPPKPADTDAHPSECLRHPSVSRRPCPTLEHSGGRETLGWGRARCRSRR